MNLTSIPWWKRFRLGFLLALLITAIIGSWYYFSPGAQEQMQVWLNKLLGDKSETPAPVPVPRVTAPAASASAPAAAASAADQTAVALAAADQALAAAQVQPVQAADATAEPVEHDVESGQTLGDVTKLRKDLKGQWRALCYENRKVLKYGCHDIRPGMVLQLVISEETKAAMPRAPRAMFEHGLRRPRVRPAAVPSQAASAGSSRWQWQNVGGAPLRQCGKRDVVTVNEMAWTELIRLGLITEADRDELRELTRGMVEPAADANGLGLIYLPTGMELEAVTFCEKGQVTTRVNAVTAWNQKTQKGAVFAREFTLKSGRRLLWVRNCFNWAVRTPVKKRDIPEPGQTTGIPGGGPVTTTPLPREPGPGPIPTAKPDKGLCERVEPEAALGQHHVPPQNGDRARSDFLTFLVDCQRRLASDDGSWGVGVKGNASQWKGTANRGSGGYRGYQWLAQGSYREILDEGRNWNVGAGVGRQRESYREGAYASETTYHLVGVTAAYNDYRRRMAGETWNVEQQYFAGITVPTSAHMSQTWFGQPTDASGMPRLKVGVQAGGRWWIHETEDSVVLPYVEAGLFVQHPTSASGNVLVGIADRNRVCGIGPGLDKDLQNGGSWVKAWGWNCEPLQGGRVAREQYRKHQFVSGVEQAGGSVDRQGMIRLPKELQSK